MTDPRDFGAETTLEGVLERIVFTDEESGWSVLRVEVEGHREAATVVGNVLTVAEGERLHFNGRWIQDRKYGQQFRADTYRKIHPSTPEGIERYLASGLIPGVGPGYAKRMVDHFGAETLEVITHHPERLKQIPGIGSKTVQKILGAWQEQRDIQEVMVFLHSQGISTAYAVRIYKVYGAEAMEKVKENPYRLAVDIFGIGFKSADRIAGNLGIPRDAPERIKAGVLYLLDQAGGHGHMFLPADELKTAACELLGVAEDAVDTAIEDLARAGRAVVEEAASFAAPVVYPKPLYKAEAELALHLSHLLATAVRGPKIDVETALSWFEKQEGLELATQQRAAIAQGLTAPVLVITGGPGTGKTTLVRGIVEILQRKGGHIQLAAPTGRAARRLGEATSREAKTVHRLLEFDPRQGTFLRNPERPLECDLLIVDEASMLDTSLARHVARAVPAGGRLILVGDADQLPSVGPGRVLHDLILSGRVPLVRLTEIFRQAAQSRIVVNAHRINHGETPLVDVEGDPSKYDFFFIERDDPADVLDTLLHLIADRIPRSFGFDPITEVQLLTPMNRGPLGVTRLNVELQQRLNPGRPALERGDRRLSLGDKVMQLRNNYDLEVFNGDIGRVTNLDKEEKELTVDFDGRDVHYEWSDLDELVPAYACTIHKSQGSEYPCVVAPVHHQHFLMLQRNLLYTAVTRAKKLVVLVGQRRALATAVRQQDTRKRNTRLADRLLAAASLAT